MLRPEFKKMEEIHGPWSPGKFSYSSEATDGTMLAKGWTKDMVGPIKTSDPRKTAPAPKVDPDTPICSPRGR